MALRSRLALLLVVALFYHVMTQVPPEKLAPPGAKSQG